MKRTSLAIFFLVIWNLLFSQDLPEGYRQYKQKYPDGPVLNNWDSLYLMNLPVKELPAELRSAPLPPVVDNSTLPYLRPVFMQEGPSCGQAAMVGYNFTYEIDYLRDHPATYALAQYPTHFTWNFQNGGNGWYGVSYFHSVEILRLCGCMNSYDYGGFYDDGKRWINGYDMYYNGMFNRVRGVYSIPVGTTQGIQALKYWLFNHMGEGTFGGVASYYANTPWNAHLLNDTTPEGGKYVMTGWYPYASHAMTIVGYNDSIRWDYNFDGQYTNHIDLNNDGIIDPRDWEIGGVKFVNSHGVDAQDSGFCYMMYKCLAETFEQGGVWNQSVHILDVIEDYVPQVTFKITLKHDSRQMVKILAGVSDDTSDVAPMWVMDFPILDFQGADHYLQGSDTAETLKYLEFGLDVTPLLDHLEPGEPAKFFFMVDENDPNQEGSGEITAFSLMDYTSGTQEIISLETPVPLENNGRTIASIIHSPDFEMVTISTTTLPPYSENEPYLHLLQATGGTSPCTWEAPQSYRMEQSTEPFPFIDDTQVLFNAANDTIVPVPLGFSFPFYGEQYDTVYMHINGHLQFDDAQLPWPYMLEPVLHFRSNRMITPMTNMDFTISMADEDGGWVEINDTSATFRWKLSATFNTGLTEINIAARINQDGRIDLLYGPSNLAGIPWLGGLSAGNKADYAECPDSGSPQIANGKKVSYFPVGFPPELDLSANGLLSGTFSSDNLIYDLRFRVKDQMGMTDEKMLQFTSGPYLYFTVDGEDHVDYGDTVGLDLEIRNGSDGTMSNTSLTISTSNPFIQLTDAACQPGTLAPGQVVNIPGAFQFIVSSGIPDQLDILFQCNLAATGQSWHKELSLKANAPVLKLKPVRIDDNDNGKLDPGETAPMIITLQNAGHAPIHGVSGELLSLDAEVQVTGASAHDFGTIGKGVSSAGSYSLHVDESAPEGMDVHFVLITNSLEGIQRQDTITLRIGRTPVLVIDMDPNHHSGPGIYSQLQELGVYSDFNYAIPENIGDYSSLFISLGYHNSNHVLTLGEGTQLAEYLNAGGKIYMEGKKTWRDDPGTPIHPMFNIGYAGTVTIYDTITGIDTTFTGGARLLNGTLYNLSFYHMVPVPPAFTILQDNNLLLPCAVAYDAGTYKTIGSLFDFGTLEDLNPSLKSDLMLAYLDFFDIYVEPVGVHEQGGIGQGDKGTGGPGDKESYTIWPNPAGDKLTVSSRQSAVGSRQSAVRLVICDVQGRTIEEFNNISTFPFEMTISNLPVGFYFLKIVSEDGSVHSERFIKSAK